jgi:hypothetical protein
MLQRITKIIVFDTYMDHMVEFLEVLVGLADLEEEYHMVVDSLSSLDFDISKMMGYEEEDVVGIWERYS